MKKKLISITDVLQLCQIVPERSKNQRSHQESYFTLWSFVKANILLNQITIYYLTFKFFFAIQPLIHDVLVKSQKVQNMKLI